MHTEEDSPLDRTPDLVAKIRALREQAEKQMNQFTRADNYEIRRVTGRKPKAAVVADPPASSPKKKQARKSEQASIDFSSTPTEHDASEGEQG